VIKTPARVPCAQWREVRRQLSDGLRFVFRHFPLTEMHPHAEHAAEAAEAARAEGEFWEMHDTLYTHQARA
jgi:protein-disulfide isomerase